MTTSPLSRGRQKRYFCWISIPGTKCIWFCADHTLDYKYLFAPENIHSSESETGNRKKKSFPIKDGWEKSNLALKMLLSKKPIQTISIYSCPTGHAEAQLSWRLIIFFFVLFFHIRVRKFVREQPVNGMEAWKQCIRYDTCSIIVSACINAIVRTSLCLSVYLSICLSAYLSVCLSISLSVCLSVCLSMCLCLRVSVAPRPPPSFYASESKQKRGYSLGNR